VEQLPPDDAGAGLALLGAELRERAGELADGMAARIRAAVPVYAAGTVISDEELRRTCLDNIGFVFGPIGRAPAVASPESRENGRRRARAGVPLAAVMAAYRVAARYLWDCLADAAARGAVPAGVTLRAASEMWLALDTFTQEMADGYREEIAFQVLSQEEERSAVVQALLEGRLDEANLWEAADILRIPLRGSYVVIAAHVPGPGRHALPQAEAALRRIGVISAWRLLPDAEVGIAWLPGPRAHLLRLADCLHSLSAGLVGVSPCYHDLRHTARNLRLARIALRSAFAAQRVTVFDRDLLAVAAGSDPEVMRRVAGSILAGLGQIPAGQRPVLLATLGAWLDNGGSASKAASVLFCHPNTVRHRMRRLEQLTGRSLSDPRGIAELSLAFEIDRRDQPSAPEAAASGPQVASVKPSIPHLLALQSDAPASAPCQP
jgi:PucR C-terminal helix-turn-helix domain/GGDEF-like domain